MLKLTNNGLQLKQWLGAGTFRTNVILLPLSLWLRLAKFLEVEITRGAYTCPILNLKLDKCYYI